ncbi:MAG: Ribose-5-phosphate isomerase A [Chlamydiia bacterium]|nr:Ribose-5-phosphate isomerase A [Chlamydiia bacterium]
MNKTAKETAAQKAAEYIKDQMVIGVGTGSTVKPFIEILNKRVEDEGLCLKAVATSIESKNSLHTNIELISEALVDQIDITVDGADKASGDFYLIKGGGGALLREKFVALNSKLNITIIDESKIASPLADHPLPVEIIPFGFKATIKRLEDGGFIGKLRMNGKKPYTTDNQNFIYDIDIQKPIESPESMHKSLKSFSGIVETGLFLQTSDIIIIGKNDLSVDVWKRG